MSLGLIQFGELIGTQRNVEVKGGTKTWLVDQGKTGKVGSRLARLKQRGKRWHRVIGGALEDAAQDLGLGSKQCLFTTTIWNRLQRNTWQTPA